MTRFAQHAPTSEPPSAAAEVIASLSARPRLSSAAAPEPLRAEICAGREVIARLNEAWDDLHARSSFGSPHVSRPWLEDWMDEEERGAEPIAVAVWEADRLVGLLVLAIRRRFRVRVAEIWGAARPSYQGALIDETCPDAAEALAQACHAHRVFDLILLENVSSLDPDTRRFVDRLRELRWRTTCARRTICRRIRLGSSFESYMRQTHSRKARYNLRRLERIARRDHDLEIQRFDGPEVTREVMCRVADIQRRSWMARRGAAEFLHTRWRNLVQKIARASLASVRILRLDGRDAAFVIATFDETCVYYEWTAFDLVYRDLSVGQLLTKHVIQAAYDETCSSLDFGQGDGAYKRFWANDSHSVDRLAAARGLTARLLLRLYHWIWTRPSESRLRRAYRALRRLRRRREQRRAPSGHRRMRERCG
jgi:CelD/BcsL family acetyltransferase involved in cellulose biosynthesis